MQPLLPRDLSGVPMQTFPADWSRVTAIEIGASSAMTDIITSRLVRVVANTDCYIAIGAEPVATAGTGSWFLPRGVDLDVPITPGQKIAALRDADDGILFVLPSR